MHRSIITTAVVLCLFALTSTCFAGHQKGNQRKGLKLTKNFQKIVPNVTSPAQMLGQPLFAGKFHQSESNKKHKKHKKHDTHNKQDDSVNNPLPLDPGRGDGQVTTTPNPSTPPNRPGFVWTGDHWERAKAPVASATTPAGKPGFVWVGDHWERVQAPVTITSTSASQGSQVSANGPFGANRGGNGRHRKNEANNPGIPPTFLSIGNSPPPAMSKPTWNSGKLPSGVTVRPGSPNRFDVIGSGSLPTIEIKGELNPAYFYRDHRNGNQIQTLGP